MTQTALVIGAGDNLGSAIARRFAREGLHVVASRRRGDLSPLIDEIETAGGQATGVHSDARDEDAVKQVVAEAEDIGPIAACVFNVGGNVRFPITETTTRVYRKVWEMCALAGFLVGREVAGRMKERGEGTILFTGASASLRGNAGFAAFAGGKHALRALAQSMARELGPEGVHVAHVIIDGLIDNPNTKDLFPAMFEARGEDGILKPDHIAEAYWQLHAQPRTAWSFEMDLRPFKEPW
ncbi:SDR family NAD(P)-dependent oxidoreductase [Shimia sp. Alg240-R146]|jgi:NAD(P)-dependent dehydrogenase (short-subunit alcohol dehydrogenase family)|uniref:SDR family NAD(P)-dependent oxidoreductase n=1 Tax=Shimia sp. Alg240-R146 TaxID=2993449 RepID=UPI0022DF656B|nr:SDR family NAD(P)-dependent oxidoreductase [Shimia sp. Alg240-R146]